MLFPTKDTLNWSVREENLFTASGIAVDKKAIIRNDNNAVLNDAIGMDYVPYQNSELFELLEKITNKTGLEVANAGYFGKGEKVFIQLKSDNLRLGTDIVEGFVTGINSFDGSTSLGFGASNVTISCQNTFFAAYKTLENKVKHTKYMVHKIDDICRELDSVLLEETAIFEKIARMAETSFDYSLREKVARQFFNIPKEVSLSDNETIKGVKRNQLSTFMVDMNGEIAEKGNNLWGLFSGVTKFSTHHASGDTMKRKLFTKFGHTERMIFEELSALV